MKYIMRYTLFMVFLLLTSTIFSQVETTSNVSLTQVQKGEVEKKQPVKLSSGSNTDTGDSVHAKYVWRNGTVTQVTKESELVVLKSLLNSLNAKEVKVRANTNAASTPETIKWLEQAALNRAKFESQIQALEQ
jgi:hypothetical protein